LSRDHHAIQIQLVDVFGKEPAGAFRKGTAANRTIKTVLVLAAKRKDLRRRLLNDDVSFWPLGYMAARNLADGGVREPSIIRVVGPVGADIEREPPSGADSRLP